MKQVEDGIVSIQGSRGGPKAERPLVFCLVWEEEGLGAQLHLKWGVSSAWVNAHWGGTPGRQCRRAGILAGLKQRGISFSSCDFSVYLRPLCLYLITCCPQWCGSGWCWTWHSAHPMSPGMREGLRVPVVGGWCCGHFLYLVDTCSLKCWTCKYFNPSKKKKIQKQNTQILSCWKKSLYPDSEWNPYDWKCQTEGSAREKNCENLHELQVRELQFLDLSFSQEIRNGKGFRRVPTLALSMWLAS